MTGSTALDLIEKAIRTEWEIASLAEIVRGFVM
jgi:hypothetical protein